MFVIVLGGCTSASDDGAVSDDPVVTIAKTEPSSTTLPPPPPDDPNSPFELEPVVVASGEPIEVRYNDPDSPDSSHGGYYFLHRWTVDGWSEPTHLIESDFLSGEPGRIYVAGVDDFAVEDYEGGSPETLFLPDLPVGSWMVCETNNPTKWCRQFTIS